jgi:hypothetical protein
MKNKSNYTNGLKGKSSLVIPVKPREIVFSFKDFDHTQGQTFIQWEQASLLSEMMNKLKEYSRKTRMEAVKAGLREYGIFPENSEFKKPHHITEDAIWASLHIQGKECVIGHLIDNIFYVVFLDREHKFWPSKLKHT